MIVAGSLGTYFLKRASSVSIELFYNDMEICWSKSDWKKRGTHDAWKHLHLKYETSLESGLVRLATEYTDRISAER